ncbi:PREDICTED: uncharacterized protein LOC105556530 [Vollenhovia emeryi]|uniref:uncharacterized protein LOC105556530 n=1 Tax=Vollenhovia emeryi TaxID=411798 RepID=UPI0005F42E5D|nr:PREDICTED: uncharacterized protein LOC105556530 [Vollenhovia emeryi]
MGDVYNMLQTKVETFKREEKHAVLLVDEMSIKPGLQYNSIAAVIGLPTMKLSNGADNTEFSATHSLVYMLCGVSSKWKQTVGYEYTGNSFCPRQIMSNIMTIIQKSHEIGLSTHTAHVDTEKVLRISQQYITYILIAFEYVL